MIHQTILGLTCMTPEAADDEAHRCLMCHDAPCTGACPASVDVMHFIRALRFENPRRAAEVIRRTNVLGGVCGSLCPRERLCEGACLRNALKDPIRIGELQTYAAATEFTSSRKPVTVSSTHGKSVAVIGAGPAGLGAAATLLDAGARVTMFEAREAPGGMLAYGVPQSRMPWSFVRRELDSVLDRGITLETGQALGRGFTLDELFDRGFEALFLGVGLWNSARLPGVSDSPDVLHALPFLEAAGRSARFGGSLPTVGNRCVVIGGGSVAMDCAQVAMELGSSEAHLVCLEGTDESPATWEDVTAAFRRGVQFWTRRRVTSIEGTDDGHRVVRTIGIRWREPGLLVPSNAEDVIDSEAAIPAQTVIVAIGQSADPGLEVALSSLDRDPGGRVLVDPVTRVTSRPGVYAGGDCAAGCGQTVVASVNDGRVAGLAIAEALGLEVPR